MKFIINEVAYTQNEIAMMRVFYDTSVDCCGSCNDEENASHNNAKDLKKALGGTKESIRGVMISLLKKGAICDMQESARGSKWSDFVLVNSDVMAYFDASDAELIENIKATIRLVNKTEQSMQDLRRDIEYKKRCWVRQ